MNKKKKTKPVSQAKSYAAASRRQHLVWLSIAGISLLIIFLALYFFKNHRSSSAGSKTISISSYARTSFPPPRAISKFDEPAFDDFAGAEAAPVAIRSSMIYGKLHARSCRRTPAPQMSSANLMANRAASRTPWLRRSKSAIHHGGAENFRKVLKWMLSLAAVIYGGTQTYSRIFRTALRFLPLTLSAERVWLGGKKAS
jgi:hypothetical protein